ncbi:hypothetical protein [Streptomyces echinatus]|uniref:Uncharacterized protein n=1 Tax=Streptomyces echinatus TaxID=67293 RepID=A0A7W9PRU2_9ACTN|nr:hypothetical protein [Streptomyces echinatus]MBB5926499.1 hypothetical protein [Streptomyces echinatus]
MPIPYVLHDDIASQLLSLEPGFGSGRTCRRRLERWPPQPYEPSPARPRKTP